MEKATHLEYLLPERIEDEAHRLMWLSEELRDDGDSHRHFIDLGGETSTIVDDLWLMAHNLLTMAEVAWDQLGENSETMVDDQDGEDARKQLPPAPINPNEHQPMPVELLIRMTRAVAALVTLVRVRRLARACHSTKVHSKVMTFLRRATRAS